MAELRAFAHESGKPQAWVNDQVALLQRMVDKGLLGQAFNPAAEVTALGENGQARMQEQEVFLTSLKDNGQLTDDEFAELSALVPTAAGTRALEKLRTRMTGQPSQVDPPAAAPADPKQAQLAEYHQMRLDPKFNSDADFKKRAETLFAQIYV